MRAILSGQGQNGLVSVCMLVSESISSQTSHNLHVSVIFHSSVYELDLSCDVSVRLRCHLSFWGLLLILSQIRCSRKRVDPKTFPGMVDMNIFLFQFVRCHSNWSHYKPVVGYWSQKTEEKANRTKSLTAPAAVMCSICCHSPSWWLRSCIEPDFDFLKC